MKSTIYFLKYIKKISPSGLINRCYLTKYLLLRNYSLAVDRKPISAQLWKTFFESPQTFIVILLANFRSSPPEVFLKKVFWKYSENMQQIYRRTSMPKCNLTEITLRHGCSTANLLHNFITHFPNNVFDGLLLKFNPLSDEVFCNISRFLKYLKFLTLQ